MQYFWGYTYKIWSSHISFTRNTPCNLTTMLMKFKQPQGNTYVDEHLASRGIEAILDLPAHSATPPKPRKAEEPSSQSTELGEIISCCYFKTLHFEVVYYTQEITETFCLFFLIFLWHALHFFCRILHTLFICLVFFPVVSSLSVASVFILFAFVHLAQWLAQTWPSLKHIEWISIFWGTVSKH